MSEHNSLVSRTADRDALRAAGWPAIPSDADTQELAAELLDTMARWIHLTRQFIERHPGDDDSSAGAAYRRGLKICTDQVQERISSTIRTAGFGE